MKISIFHSLLVAGIAVISSPAFAANFVVNTTTDIVGPPQTLVMRCLSQQPANQCSLRDAAKLSSQLPGPDTLILAGGTYALSLGELKLVGDVTITGVSPQATVITNAAGKKNRVLNFEHAKKVSVSRVSVTGGYLEAHLSSTDDKRAGGAGIRAVNVDELALASVHIKHNTMRVINDQQPWEPNPVKDGIDRFAAAALYVEGGLSTHKATISSNVVQGGDSMSSLVTTGIIWVEAKNAQQSASLRESFVENNLCVACTVNYAYHDTNLVTVKAQSVAIVRTFFRNNKLGSLWFGPRFGESADSVVAVSQSGFANNAANTWIASGAGMLDLQNSSFDESAAVLLIGGENQQGVDGLALRWNPVINNTFESTTLTSAVGNSTGKTLTLLNGNGNSPQSSIRRTLLAHNTISYVVPDVMGYEAVALEVQHVPVELLNNIIRADSGGFEGKTFPCFDGWGDEEDGNLTSLGGNLVYGASVQLDTPGSRNCRIGMLDPAPADPKLMPLQWNGGWTWTMALQDDSPALSIADPLMAAAIPFDQRGVKRPLGAGADIGAYESDGGPIFD